MPAGTLYRKTLVPGRPVIDIPTRDAMQSRSLGRKLGSNDRFRSNDIVVGEAEKFKNKRSQHDHGAVKCFVRE